MQFRKLAAVAGSALMLGATLAGAATVTKVSEITSKLGTPEENFPVFVVGADAKASDVAGAIDIAVRLAANSKTTKEIAVEGAGKEVVVSEGVSLDQPGEKIYLNNTINSVKDALTSKDLPELLEKGTFEDEDGNTYDYTQRIEIGSAPVQFEQEETGKDPVVEIKLSTRPGTPDNYNYGTPLYTLRVDFNEAVAFNKSASYGNTLKLFGTEFTVSSETTSSKLVLYKAAQEITLHKDEEKTITVGGKSYTIKVLGFDTGGAKDKVILEVNGDTDDVAEESPSKKIGGLQVYAKTVTAWNDGQEGIAVLQVGSEKVILKNGDYVRVGEDEDRVDGTLVRFNEDFDEDDAVGHLSSIEIMVYAKDSDHDYIAAGEEFVDPFTGNFKIAFNGITPDLKDSSRDEIKFRVSGDYKGYVTFKDVNGNEATVYFAYGSSSNDDTIALQDDSQNAIYVVEGAEAKEDEIIFLSPGKDKERYAHMVRVERIETDSSEGYVEFRDVITGDTYKTQKGEFDSQNDHLDLIVDGKTYTVTLTSTDPKKIKVEYTGDEATVVYPAIELNNGEKLAFVKEVTLTGLSAGSKILLPTGEITITSDGKVPGTSINVTDTNDDDADTIQVGQVYYYVDDTGTAGELKIALEKDQDNNNDEETNPAVIILEEEDDDNNENAVIVVTADGDGSEGGSHKSPVSFETLIMTANTKWTDVGTSDDDVNAYLDYYGTYAEVDTSDSDHTIVTVWYPDSQVYASVGAGSEVKFTTGGAGTAQTEVVVPVTSDIAYLDTQVTDEIKQNYDLIVVGGPCVNRLAAELLGKTFPACGAESGIPENAAIVKVFPNAFAEGKTAVLVAGWSAENTKKACTMIQSGRLDSYDMQAVKITDSTVEELTVEGEKAEEGEGAE